MKKRTTAKARREAEQILQWTGDDPQTLLTLMQLVALVGRLRRKKKNQRDRH